MKKARNGTINRRNDTQLSIENHDNYYAQLAPCYTQGTSAASVGRDIPQLIIGIFIQTN